MSEKKRYSDGESDGIVIFYLKDGELYPTAISTDVLDLVGFILSDLTIIDKPLGVKVTNLVGKGNNNGT